MKLEDPSMISAGVLSANLFLRLSPRTLVQFDVSNL
jgi:hypothetical protein